MALSAAHGQFSILAGGECHFDGDCWSVEINSCNYTYVYIS